MKNKQNHQIIWFVILTSEQLGMKKATFTKFILFSNELILKLHYTEYRIKKTWVNPHNYNTENPGILRFCNMWTRKSFPWNATVNSHSELASITIFTIHRTLSTIFTWLFKTTSATMKSFMQKNASKEGLGNDDDFFLSVNYQFYWSSDSWSSFSDRCKSTLWSASYYVDSQGYTKLE